MKAREADLRDPGPPAVAVRSSSLVRSANESLRTGTTALGPSEQIAFLCECHNPSCYRAVWMSSSAFDAAAADDVTWVLAEGHEPSASWRPLAPMHYRASTRRRPAPPVPSVTLRRRVRQRRPAAAAGHAVEQGND